MKWGTAYKGNHFFFSKFISVLKERYRAHAVHLHMQCPGNVLQLIFCNFLVRVPKFVYWVAGWLLAVGSKYFGDFLGISFSYLVSWDPQSSLKIPGNPSGNMLIHFLLILIKFRFTCDEEKLLKPEKVHKCFVRD